MTGTQSPLTYAAGSGVALGSGTSAPTKNTSVPASSSTRQRTKSRQKSRHKCQLLQDAATNHRSLDDQIHFYHQDKPYYEFTNFYSATVNIDGKSWPTTEHYFQAQKFVGTPYVEKIRNLPTPRDAFQLSRDPQVSRWRRSDWESVKDDVMLRALRVKFSSSRVLCDKLCGTGMKELVEHTSNDSYWGDGGDGSGRNKLGKILMQVRRELKATRPPYTSPYAQENHNNPQTKSATSTISPNVSSSRPKNTPVQSLPPGSSSVSQPSKSCTSVAGELHTGRSTLPNSTSKVSSTSTDLPRPSSGAKDSEPPEESIGNTAHKQSSTVLPKSKCNPIPHTLRVRRSNSCPNLSSSHLSYTHLPGVASVVLGQKSSFAGMLLEQTGDMVETTVLPKTSYHSYNPVRTPARMSHSNSCPSSLPHTAYLGTVHCAPVKSRQRHKKITSSVVNGVCEESGKTKKSTSITSPKHCSSPTHTTLSRRHRSDLSCSRSSFTPLSNLPEGSTSKSKSHSSSNPAHTSLSRRHRSALSCSRSTSTPLPESAKQSTSKTDSAHTSLSRRYRNDPSSSRSPFTPLSNLPEGASKQSTSITVSHSRSNPAHTTLSRRHRSDLSCSRSTFTPLSNLPEGSTSKSKSHSSSNPAHTSLSRRHRSDLSCSRSTLTPLPESAKQSTSKTDSAHTSLSRRYRSDPSSSRSPFTPLSNLPEGASKQSTSITVSHSRSNPAHTTLSRRYKENLTRSPLFNHSLLSLRPTTSSVSGSSTSCGRAAEVFGCTGKAFESNPKQTTSKNFTCVFRKEQFESDFTEEKFESTPYLIQWGA